MPVGAQPLDGVGTAGGCTCTAGTPGRPLASPRRPARVHPGRNRWRRLPARPDRAGGARRRRGRAPPVRGRRRGRRPGRSGRSRSSTSAAGAGGAARASPARRATTPPAWRPAGRFYVLAGRDRPTSRSAERYEPRRRALGAAARPARRARGHRLGRCVTAGSWCSAARTWSRAARRSRGRAVRPAPAALAAAAGHAHTAPRPWRRRARRPRVRDRGRAGAGLPLLERDRVPGRALSGPVGREVLQPCRRRALRRWSARPPRHICPHLVADAESRDRVELVLRWLGLPVKASAIMALGSHVPAQGRHPHRRFPILTVLIIAACMVMYFGFERGLGPRPDRERAGARVRRHPLRDHPSGQRLRPDRRRRGACEGQADVSAARRPIRRPGG